jgi:rubrerythrin
MSKTRENLQAAFAGESQANRKYLAFAKKAEEENKQGLAKIFRVAAAGETVHALNHFNVLGGVSESMENLKQAIAGETYEITEMYPKFIEEAIGEKENKALISFGGANKVEKIHQELFQKALDENGEIADQEYYVCGVCGFPSEGEAPDHCPICGASKEKFSKVE